MRRLLRDGERRRKRAFAVRPWCWTGLDEVDNQARYRRARTGPSTVILLTWDDYGAGMTSRAPTGRNNYGLGFRVPLLMISPFAKQGHIDHTLSDHTS